MRLRMCTRSTQGQGHLSARGTMEDSDISWTNNKLGWIILSGIKPCTFDFFSYRIFSSRIQMPRQKCCQHPTRHENSTVIAMWNMPVSLELAKFLHNQYGLSGGYIRWLCANCRSLETKIMRSYRSTEEAEDQSSSNNESTSENSSNDFYGAFDNWTRTTKFGRDKRLHGAYDCFCVLCPKINRPIH